MLIVYNGNDGVRVLSFYVMRIVYHVNSFLPICEIFISARKNNTFSVEYVCWLVFR